MADLIFTEQHAALRQSIRKFVAKEITPYYDAWEDARELPRSLFREMGDAGLLGLRIPEEHGGSGGDIFSSMVLIEELSGAGAESVTMAVAVSSEYVAPTIVKYGTPEQKKRYLPALAAGECIGALGITEANAGSDVSSIQTRAVRQAPGWVVNGSKMFITNGVICDVVMSVVRTAGQGHHAFSLFLIDRGLPGFSVSRKMKKIGRHASDTAELLFEDCRVSADALLGVEGRGFSQIMWELQVERLLSSCANVAAARYAFNMTLEYAKQRLQFGKPIAEQQVIRHYAAEMAARIEAAAQMTYVTAWRFQQGEYPVKEISMCKLISSEALWFVADTCMQIHGAYGYIDESRISRAWRDARLKRIGAGSNEIQKNVIAKQLGL